MSPFVTLEKFEFRSYEDGDCLKLVFSPETIHQTAWHFHLYEYRLIERVSFHLGRSFRLYLRLDRALDPRGHGSIFREQGRWKIDLTENQFGIWCEFFLQFTRDNGQSVDHLDFELDAAPGDLGGLDLIVMVEQP
jgi:hypothetical protein